MAASALMLGYLGIGFAAGVVERAAGMSYAEILLLSMVLYAGSAQFVLTSMLVLGNPAPAIVLTVFFLNLRHLLLSAALAPALRALPAWKNALLGLQLTDETFVVASARGQLSAAWMAGLNLAAWGTWALANIAGGALSGYAGNIKALAFALPSMFAGLIVLQLFSHKVRFIALLVMALSAGAGMAIHHFFPGPWAVIGAALLGASAGLALQRWKFARSS
jgi:predicted branched-subunit amino acid permease